MKTLTKNLTVFLLVLACLLLVSGCETNNWWRDYMHSVSGKIASNIVNAPLLLGGIVLSLFGVAIALACRSRCLKSVPIRQSRHDTPDVRRS